MVAPLPAGARPSPKVLLGCLPHYPPKFSCDALFAHRSLLRSESEKALRGPGEALSGELSASAHAILGRASPAGAHAERRREPSRQSPSLRFSPGAVASGRRCPEMWGSPTEGTAGVFDIRRGCPTEARPADPGASGRAVGTRWEAQAQLAPVPGRASPDPGAPEVAKPPCQSPTASRRYPGEPPRCPERRRWRSGLFEERKCHLRRRPGRSPAAPAEAGWRLTGSPRAPAARTPDP